MDLKCKLIKKTFTAENGDLREYHVLQFPISDGETIEIPIKKDKANLLRLSTKLNFPEKPFWSDTETNSLN